MEEQLLPLPELEPAYEKAVWLYVFRDFSGDERDRADERIALRFGFSSYPQHKLVNPETLELIADTGRSIESFTRALTTTMVKISKTTDAAGRLRAAEERAIRLWCNSLGLPKTVNNVARDLRDSYLLFKIFDKIIYGKIDFTF